MKIGKNLLLEKDKQGQPVLFGILGSKIHDIITDAIAYVQAEGIEKIRLADLNGIDIEIDKNTTLESATEDFNNKQNEAAAQREQEHAEWLKSPEGQEYTKEQEKEKAEHEAYVFHSVDEALLALSEVKPCLLSQPTTSHADALRFCKEVMEIILKCEDLNFNPDQQKEFSSMLLLLGARSYKQVDEKFIIHGAEASVGEIISSKNNIEFPISVFGQLIDTKPSPFNYGLAIATEGGLKNSWIGQWLKAQKEQEKTINNSNK